MVTSMPGDKRFYRFNEFGRELLYDTQGTTAFFINEVEDHLLDLIQEGKSRDECTAELNQVYTDEVINKAVQRLSVIESRICADNLIMGVHPSDHFGVFTVLRFE